MIYLDNAATSFPKPEGVYAILDRFAREGAGNPGRSGHRFARASEEAIRGARLAVAGLLGAPDPDRVVFTLNATDALNMAIKGVLRAGDHAITTDIEHNSVSRPLEGLAARGVISLTRLATNEDGCVTAGAVAEALTPATRLVAICHASNVLGVVQDAAAIAKVAHGGGAVLVLDASQSAGVLPIDVQAMDVDLLCFTGHKALFGPMGTGGLVVGERVDLGPWREGGTGGDSGSATQPREYPHWLEGGTPNAVGLAGLGAGIRYVRERGVETIGRHEREMAARFARAIAASPRVRIVAAPRVASSEAGDRDGAEAAGPGPGSGGNRTRAISEIGLVSFTIEGFEPQEVAAVLDERFGVGVRAGLHCAPYIHRRLGLFPAGTVRATPGPFTLTEEIDEAARALLEIAAV